MLLAVGTPLGELLSIVDAGKNPTSLSYDLAGRRKTLTSPDTGTTTWRYHPSGDLREREDAAGRVVSYEYLLGRLDKVKHSGTEVVTYSYGLQGTNDAGRVTLVTDEAGWERRSYGPLGEVVKTVRQVRPLSPGAGPQEFTTEFDFDAFGRMQWIRYPDGETVSYAYDAGGLLFSATGSRPPSVSADAPSESYVRSIQYDEFGQRTRLVLGNGVETVYGYQPTTRRLSTLTTTTPAQRAIQQLAYGYDPVGNVLTLSNNLGPAYPGRAGATSYTFEYDSLYRLRYSKGAALARTGTVDVFESTFGYSNIHNLTRKWQRREVRRADSLEGVTVEVPDHSSYDWSYQYHGAGPHQVSQVADTSFGYDAAGNTLTECVMPPGTGTTCRNGNKYGQKTRRYQWADDGTLKGVVYPGEGRIVRFLYDSGGQRVAKLGRGEPNLSIGQWYGQKGGVFYTKHIFAGATRVASRLEKVQEIPAPVEVTAPLLASAGCLGCAAAVQAAPAPQPGPWHEATFYYHQDHLGSTSWLTDQYGRPRERVEYFPYGEVWRDEKEGGELGPPGVDRFLFTGKQLDEETGLTYFGARYYDSILICTNSSAAVCLGSTQSSHGHHLSRKDSVCPLQPPDHGRRRGGWLSGVSWASASPS